MRTFELLLSSCFLFISAIGLHGQETPPWDPMAQQAVFYFDPDTLDRNYNGLSDYAYMFVDSTRSLTIDEIKVLDFHQKADFSVFDKIGGLFEYPVWVKFVVKPEQKLPLDSVILNIPFGINYEVFELTKDTIFKSIGGIDSWKSSSQLEFCKFSIPLRELDPIQRSIYIKYAGYSRSALGLHIASIKERISFHEANFFARKGKILYLFALISSIAFLAIFFLVRFLILRETFLLYYGLYLLGIGFILLENLERLAEMHVFWQRIGRSDHLIFIFIPAVFFLFGLYTKHLVGIDRSHKLWVYYRVLMATLIIGFVINLAAFLLFLGFGIRYNLQILAGISYLPAALAGTAISVKLLAGKEIIDRLIGAGITSVTLACLIISVLLAIRLQCRYNLFLEIGYIIQILFFTLAIGYRTKSTQLALLNSQKDLLEKEKLNLLNQQKLNSELSMLVEAKTRDIIATNKALADQEKLKLEAEFSEKIANAELKALKAQMNPHFIFNCLNAIRNLVQKGKDELATEYLSDFASFIRKVLSFSEERQITLDEELELCELYLRMEQLRFEDGFAFKIQVDPGTATDFIMLPPMLLQPLLENAIWHGLLHKKENRVLNIHIRQDEKQVICTIDDNGVGRAYATLMNGTKNKKSIGLKLFIDRLDVNNQLLDNHYHYEIVDKYQNDISTGTRVNLYFEI